MNNAHNLLSTLVVAAAFTGFAAGCASTDAQQQPDAEPASEPQETTAQRGEKGLVPQVDYYVGLSQASSPDGSIPYGPPQAAVAMRALFPDDERIEETVWYDGAMQKTVLTRTEEGAFVGSDEHKTFEATLQFSGTPWQWTSWTYDIALADNKGKVTGVGTRDAEKMTNDKTFHGPDGKPQARIIETYARTDRAAFDAAVAELEATAKAAADAAAGSERPEPPAIKPGPQPN